MRIRLAGAVAIAAAALCALGGVPAWAEPVSCGQVITEDTTLEGDLECDVPEAALVIGAPGITLDLGGHTLISHYSGILNEGHDQVTIRNGTVNAQTGAVVLRGVERNEVRDVRAEGLLRGFDVTDSDHNRFLSNVLNSVYFSVERSDRNTIRGNRTRDYESGLTLRDSSRNQVIGNSVGSERAESFLSVTGGAHNRIARNTFETSWWAPAAWLVSTEANEFVDNVVGSAGPEPGIGLRVVASSRNRILRNRFLENPAGVWLESGADNVLSDNHAAAVFPDPSQRLVPEGYRVDAPATNTMLARNTAVGFDDDGFDIEAPGTALRRNRADLNGDLGIEAVPGVIDLGGNRASGNGNPLQCLNVVCR